MVSCHIPMETLRAEVEKFKGGKGGGSVCFKYS